MRIEKNSFFFVYRQKLNDTIRIQARVNLMTAEIRGASVPHAALANLYHVMPPQKLQETGERLVNLNY